MWNQLIIKGFSVPVNLQNMILYTFGSLIAAVLYVQSCFDKKCAPPPPSRPRPPRAAPQLAAAALPPQAPRFLEGYTPLAIALVIFQAFHGIAVAFVYKYADAIVKNFANSSVMAILVVVSATFFQLSTNVHSWLGVVIVLTTTYCYMNIALKIAAPPPPAETERLLEAGEAKEETRSVGDESEMAASL